MMAERTSTRVGTDVRPVVAAFLDQSTRGGELQLLATLEPLMTACAAMCLYCRFLPAHSYTRRTGISTLVLVFIVQHNSDHGSFFASSSVDKVYARLRSLDNDDAVCQLTTTASSAPCRMERPRP